MTKQRMFLDISCVDAARQRIRHVYDNFDTVCVQFSGGKDSTAVLYLAKEIHEERGLGPVKVIFRDQEMVSPLVHDYVNKVRQYDWVDMEWYCLPYPQEVWVLGVRENILSWDSFRKLEGRLVREMPEWAIHAGHFGLPGDQVMPEGIDYYTMQGKTGSIAFITGVRANESMVRYRSLVQKVHENYIVSPYKMKKSIPLKFAKVIYDWQMDDVLKFISEEHNAEYCEYYDLAAMTGSNTRVGVPLHAVAIRRIGDLVMTEPGFYDTLWQIWPNIDAQRRWWPDFDIEKFIQSYAIDGFEGAKRCINENMLDEIDKRRARAYTADFRKKHIKDPYSYPINWLIRNLILNEITVSAAAPVGPKTKAHTLRAKAAEQELNNEQY
jgi:3'-phosphoadenosine 5'-phosphosulfate sulfotransferase (PAPS reductase)/FAD synthetase